MKLRGSELLVLIFLLSRARRGRVSTEPFNPEPGPDPLPVVPLPPNPLDPNNQAD